MVFLPQSLTPPLAEVPDTIPICDFIFNEKHGRRPISESLDSYICGISGKRISAKQQKDQVGWLANSLSRVLGWNVNEGSEFEKVMAIFALNTIDIMTVSWAVHRLNGVSSPANSAYSVDELHHQLVSSGAKAMFTVRALLDTALKAAAKAKLPKDKIFLCDMPGDAESYDLSPQAFTTFHQLTSEGRNLPPLEDICWSKGQGARSTAFLCYSSGTSGLPKAVMITHRNVIANTLQISLFDHQTRESFAPQYRDVALGLLPQSHIYSLIIICHASTYRGDSVVVLSKFELNSYLQAIQKYRITTLYLVPPIVITMVNNKDKLKASDLSSVKQIFSGAAPLGEEVSKSLLQQYPSWKLRQAYGMTETCTVVSSTSADDVWLGSSGSLLPGFEVKLVKPDGMEVTGYNEPGEILVKSPSVVIGYFNNETATQETFMEFPEGRFIRTGDEAEFRLSSKGHEHLWVTDRIKELIKVKGHQVAPAELESCLLNHPDVADCAVISVPDDSAGEVPKAFIVRASCATASGDALTRNILAFVQERKARYKWIQGGIEYTDVIPKSPSGKILRRILRDLERERRRKAQAKI